MEINKMRLKCPDTVRCSVFDDHITCENTSSTEAIVEIAKLYKNLKQQPFTIHFDARVEYGQTSVLRLTNRFHKTLRIISPTENFLFDQDPPRLFYFEIKIPPLSAVQINQIYVEYDLSAFYQGVDACFQENLLVGPGYPSEGNKYYWAFLHTRILAYRNKGLNFHVVIPEKRDNIIQYEFEGVTVYKIGYVLFREKLQKYAVNRIKNLLVHYLSNTILNILSAVYLKNVNVLFYFHSADALYRDYSVFNSKYFKKALTVSEDLKKDFDYKDRYLRHFAASGNVTFVFPTKWVKNRFELTTGISLQQYSILPTPIDFQTFTFKPKDESSRKKIVIIRKFDDFSTYAVDINIKCILALSKKPLFEDLEFNIYGDGSLFDQLLAPIKQFKNVKIHRGYLSHDDMATIFSQNGIGLFASRMETQGVAAAEAAATGLVVLSSNVGGVSEILDNTDLSEVEDYQHMADLVEYYYNNPEEYLKASKRNHECVSKSCGYEATIGNELKLLKTDGINSAYMLKEPTQSPLLTITIPSYNASLWLRHGVETLLNAKNSNRLEILIVNDGSKDNTAQIGEELESLSKVAGKSIVRLINKENGGHGSTINTGIREARGKYFKLMDADDYFNTEALDELVELLETEESDMVLTNYVEDQSVPAEFVHIHEYDFMEPGKQYNLEDLCYEGYGFGKFANILHTSTYKTQILKDMDFSISEHSFYVDMEMNTITFILSKTVVYYPLDLYVYYLGRSGQSVSPASFKKNYKQHERILFRIIDEIQARDLSYNKKYCLFRTILRTMLKTQYHIYIEYLKSAEGFKEFDNRIKNYPELYNDPEIVNKKIKKCRETNGAALGKQKSETYEKAITIVRHMMPHGRWV